MQHAGIRELRVEDSIETEIIKLVSCYCDIYTPTKLKCKLVI